MNGLDWLGGANYGDLILREHPAGWAAGFMLNTNDPRWPKSNCWPVIEALLATGRCPRVRLQAVWEDNHTYNPRKHDALIMKELRRAIELKRKFPAVDIQFSPFCEHTARGQMLRQLFNPLLEPAKAGGVRLVNSVWKGDFAFFGDIINEVHGTHRPPRGVYNYSFDGLSAVDANVEQIKRQYRAAETFYWWHPAMNGRLNTNDRTPRNKRKAWPTSELVDSVIYLRTERGKARLPRTHIWKTHADRHETPPEPRAYKPVLIAPEKANRAELVADNGQVVAVSQNRLAFNDGRSRYYFSEYGYQLAEKAVRIQGHPIVRIRIGRKFVGRVNPAFRAGSFRD